LRRNNRNSDFDGRNVNDRFRREFQWRQNFGMGKEVQVWEKVFFVQNSILSKLLTHTRFVPQDKEQIRHAETEEKGVSVHGQDCPPDGSKCESLFFRKDEKYFWTKT
jgi:hypothetical protein